MLAFLRDELVPTTRIKIGSRLRRCLCRRVPLARSDTEKIASVIRRLFNEAFEPLKFFLLSFIASPSFDFIPVNVLMGCDHYRLIECLLIVPPEIGGQSIHYTLGRSDNLDHSVRRVQLSPLSITDLLAPDC